MDVFARPRAAITAILTAVSFTACHREQHVASFASEPVAVVLSEGLKDLRPTNSREFEQAASAILSSKQLKKDGSDKLSKSDLDIVSFVNLAIGQAATELNQKTLEVLKVLPVSENLDPKVLIPLSHAVAVNNFNKLNVAHPTMLHSVDDISEMVFDANPVFRDIRAGKTLSIAELESRAKQFRHQGYAVKILKAALPEAISSLDSELSQKGVVVDYDRTASDSDLTKLMTSFSALFNAKAELVGSKVRLEADAISSRHIAAIECSQPALTLEYLTSPSSMGVLAMATAENRCGLNESVNPYVVKLMHSLLEDVKSAQQMHASVTDIGTIPGVDSFFLVKYGIPTSSK